jgi:hypothetical protein
MKFRPNISKLYPQRKLPQPSIYDLANQQRRKPSGGQSLVNLAIAQGGLLFGSEFKNEPRTSWNTAGFQYDNAITELPPNVENVGLDFTSTNTDYIACGDLGNIQTVAFWVKLDSTSEDILQLNATTYVTASSGTLSVAGTALETIYVNGVETSTIGTDWTHVNITFSSAIDANLVYIARQNSSYGDLSIKDVVFLSSINSSLSDVTNIIGLSDKVAVYPLAGYSVADGARTAGDAERDYSGNSNDCTIQGTSVTPVYTPDIGYQVSEDAYNTSGELRLFDVGTGFDIDGTSIPAFTGATAPDAKAFTGGALDFTSTNNDYVGIPINANGWTSYEIFGWFEALDEDQTLMSFSSAGGNGFSLNTENFGAGRFQFIHQSTSEISTINLTAGQRYFVALTWDGSTINMHIYDEVGAFVETVTASDSNIPDFDNTGRLGRLAGGTGYYNGSMKDVYIRRNPSSFIYETILNNPNKFVETAQGDADCIAAYDMNQGTIEDGEPLIDVSGNNNHGTASGASIAMVNNVEVGSQTVTHGWSLYDYVSGTGTISISGTALTGSGTSFTTQLEAGDLIWASDELVQIASITDNTNAVLQSAPDTDFSGDSFNILDQDSGSDNRLIPAISDKGTEDIFGNTVQLVWKEGYINRSPFLDKTNNASGILIGSESGFFDQWAMRGFVVLSRKISDTASWYIFANKGSGVGELVQVNEDNRRYIYQDNSTGDNASVTLANNPTKWFYTGFDISASNLVDVFAGDQDTEVVLDNTDQLSTVRDTPTDFIIPKLFIRPSNFGGSFDVVAQGTILIFSSPRGLINHKKLQKQLNKLIP